MNDTFESDLRRLLNQSVDAQLGPRRQAPPFAAGRPARGHHLRHWTAPLLAAACVVAVAVAAIGGARTLTGHPAGPAAPSTRHPTPTGKPHLVTLGAARLSLPAGWVARSYQLYTPSVQPLVATPTWCLTPASTPVSAAPGGCPISFGPIPRPLTGNVDPEKNHVDADVEGGLWGNPLYCISRKGGGAGLESAVAAEVPFGTRSADFRDWRFRCNDGKAWWIRQYLVVSDPGFILLSETVTPEIASAMSSIVAQSSLPARTGALRYFDEGTVLESTPVDGGVRIRLKRQFLVPSASIPHAPDPSQLDYVIPLALFKQHQNLYRPHARTAVYTDGNTVIWATSF